MSETSLHLNIAGLFALLVPHDQRLLSPGYTYESSNQIAKKGLDGNVSTLTWLEYKTTEYDVTTRTEREAWTGEWSLELAADLWGVLSALVLLRLLNALTLWDQLGPLLIMIRRMMFDLFVFVVLYIFILTGFAILFTTLFAATGNDNFATLGQSIAYLFYSGLGAFDQNEDIEGRSWELGNGHAHL